MVSRMQDVLLSRMGARGATLCGALARYWALLYGNEAEPYEWLLLYSTF